MLSPAFSRGRFEAEDLYLSLDLRRGDATRLSRGATTMAEEKTNRRTADALKAIEDAVFSLLEEKEFEHVTARDICQRAKVNKMTFYKYHNNKYDALAKAFTSRLNAEYKAKILDFDHLYKDDMDEAHFQGLMFVLDFFERYRVAFSHLVSSSGDFPRDVVFSALFANYLPFFSAVIGEEINHSNEYLVHFIFGAYRSLFECQLRQLAQSPNGEFDRQAAEKACRLIAKSFTMIFLTMRKEHEDKVESKSIS